MAISSGNVEHKSEGSANRESRADQGRTLRLMSGGPYACMTLD